MNCTNCGTEVNSKYCPDCGQAKSLKRIDGHYIVHEIEHILHFERGILYTIRELSINPGQNIRKYLSENRTRLVKPIIFIIITSLIYTLLTHFFHVDDGYVKFKGTISENQSAVGSIVKWVQDHYGYANIFMGVCIALWLNVFFRKSSYNFYEILILLCFVMGMGMLIFSVFVILEGLTHFSIMTAAGVIGIAYCVWAIGQFYENKKASSYLKALAAYILGMITFWIIPILSGTIIDLLNKH
jgi:glutaredoxin